MLGDQYQNVVVRLYRNKGEPSSQALRAEPEPGQGVPPWRVSFQRPIGAREGSRVLIAVLTETSREGTPYLRAANRKDQVITLLD